MQYYRALSSAAGIPLILYYMPQPGVSFSLGEVLETLTVPGVTDQILHNDFLYPATHRGKTYGLCSPFRQDEYLAPAVIHGADGGIGMWATVFPKVYAGIYRAAETGRLQTCVCAPRATSTRVRDRDAAGAVTELCLHLAQTGDA